VQDNQALCTQVSVSLLHTEGAELIHNQLCGLPANAFPNGPGLTRDTIDAFQSQISSLFATATAAANFQAAGVLIYTANGVVIRANLILAQVAVFGFLLINADIEQNEVLSLVGVLVVFALLVKIENNFVLGLFAGVIHAGITAIVDYTSNEWVGLNGILWMSLAELLASFGKLLGAALNAVGFAGTGGDVLKNVAKLGATASGEVRGFGLVMMAKIHRNDFLTFSRGVYKTNSVVSGDVSIIDNSFLLCSQTGVELGGGLRNHVFALSLPPTVSLRHLIQSNAFTVQGAGVVTSTPLTLVEQNTIECKSVAIEVDAGTCTVKNNVVRGLATEAVVGVGLITLYNGAQNITIAGNELLNAAGHSILFREDVSIVAIEDNLIEGARCTGIGTRNDAVRLQRIRVSRNRIERCQGIVPAGAAQFSGAVAIGEAEDVQLVENTIANNSPVRAPNTAAFWFAVYFGTVDGIQVRGNTLNDNATTPGLGMVLGATLLRGTGIVCVHGNVFSGNGGAALELFMLFGTGTKTKHVMVQNNHFSGGPNQFPSFVAVEGADSLLFEGNQCVRTVSPAGAQFGRDVDLSATRANVCGNSVEASSFAGMTIRGNRLVISANSVQSPGLVSLQASAFSLGAPGPVAMILSSNLATGIAINASSAGVLNRVGNFPAP